MGPGLVFADLHQFLWSKTVNPGLLVIALAAAGLSCGVAGACTFSSDCVAGYSCYKASGGAFGICAGELMPSKSGKAKSAASSQPSPLSSRCRFDTDCVTGAVCAKSSTHEAACRRAAPR